MIDNLGFRTNALPSPPHRGVRQADDKARKAAKQFEAVLLSNMFQSLQESVSSFSDEAGDSSSKTFSELGIQQLATAAADAGGIGISRIVTNYLEDQSATGTSESSPLNFSQQMPIYKLHSRNSEVLGK